MIQKQVKVTFNVVHSHTNAIIKQQKLKAFKLLFRILQGIVGNKKVRVFKLMKFTIVPLKFHTKNTMNKSMIDQRVEDSIVIDDSHIETDDFFDELENEYH